jgi:hypothetical protein
MVPGSPAQTVSRPEAVLVPPPRTKVIFIIVKSDTTLKIVLFFFFADLTARRQAPRIRVNDVNVGRALKRAKDSLLNRKSSSFHRVMTTSCLNGSQLVTNSLYMF